MYEHPPGVVGPATDVHRHVLLVDDPRPVHPRGGRRHDLCHPPQCSHSEEDANIAGMYVTIERRGSVVVSTSAWHAVVWGVSLRDLGKFVYLILPVSFR